MRKIAIIVLLLTGCGTDSGVPRFPINLLDLTYQFRSSTDGVYPSQTILLDENNPFVEFGMSQDLAFEIDEIGSRTGSYYAWGTLLANGGSDPGVAQFFTAVGLQGILESGDFTPETNPNDIRDQAIAAYQSMLDNYPGTLLDLTGQGETFVRLAPLAYLAIAEDLNGTVLGNWVLIEFVDENGEEVKIVVQGGGEPVLPPELPPAEEEEEEEG